MHAELVKTTASDGLRLDGALHLPSSDSGNTAALLLHGVSSNFYGSSLMESLAAGLIDKGIAALRVNTRGHDLVCLGVVEGRMRWEGAAFETVSKCVRDLSAWIRFLHDRGFSRVLLVGHSLGAIKSLYAASHGVEPEPAGIIAMSPPRLSYQAFMNGPDQPAFFAAIEQAREHQRNARHSALMQVKFPFPLLISAASYLDKYGPEENYNILKFADQVSCPLLFMYGELELQDGGVAFAGLPEALQKLPHQGEREYVTISAADHMYTGVYQDAVTEVAAFATRFAD